MLWPALILATALIICLARRGRATESLEVERGAAVVGVVVEDDGIVVVLLLLLSAATPTRLDRFSDWLAAVAAAAAAGAGGMVAARLSFGCVVTFVRNIKIMCNTRICDASSFLTCITC